MPGVDRRGAVAAEVDEEEVEGGECCEGWARDVAEGREEEVIY